MSARQGYGAIVLEHYRRPRNRGALPAADASVEGTTPLCGDHVRMEVALDRDVVREVRFAGDACAVATAAASVLTEHVRRLTASQVAALRPDDVAALLGTEVPPARLACLRLPLDVLHGALRRWAASAPDAA